MYARNKGTKGENRMKPIIGICTNYSTDEKIGMMTELGFAGQDWQLLAGDYIRAVERAGGIPIIIPIVENHQTLEPILDRIDGIIFSGGSDIDPQCYGELPRYGIGRINPVRDAQEIALAKKVLYEKDFPVLGICRGIQLLTVVSGGTLYQDLRSQRPEGFNHTLNIAPKYHPTHPVDIQVGSKLYEIFGKERLGINGFNHQAVKELGKDFSATMLAPDGLVEGMELLGERFVIGLQWHPEMMIDRYPEYLAIFTSFVESCKQKI